MARSSQLLLVATLTIATLAGVSTTQAQWNPSNGQWGKDDSTDIRIMTWNVKDAICRTNPKQEGVNNWCAVARIIAAMKPDILILQECGDNNGNGTGSNCDSVYQLGQVMNMLFAGGYDFYLSATVTSYVQAYDADVDLPYVFVSSETDGYNRNVIVSRFPFADLNGDSTSLRSDIYTIQADEYAPGGDGGIRGFMFAEIDLPDETYAGDIVIGNAHLKSGSGSSDIAQRHYAARNVAYFIDYFYNGAGTGTPDPNNKISDSPSATSILGDDTAIVVGGDWNEDEATNGRKGPAEWITLAEYSGGSDGTDRDRSDMTYDDAREPHSNVRYTLSNTKFDYLAWQDSIVTLRRDFIFDSTRLASASSWYPDEVLWGGSTSTISDYASDHCPVIIDLIAPMPSFEMADLNCDGAVNFNDIDPFVAALISESTYYADYPDCDFWLADINDSGVVNFEDIDPFVECLVSGGCP